MRYLLPILALTLLFVACTAPNGSTDASCAAVTCPVGSACKDGTCIPPAPEENAYVTCTDPRPEACTLDYNPVCASVDNGIRCITTPCPSEDLKTYSNGCGACADPNVYGYKLGACDPEVDNNPSDDDTSTQEPTDGLVHQFMICKTADYDRTDFAQEYGYTCVESCPNGYDRFAGQIGLFCIPHYGRAEIERWSWCDRGDVCNPEQRCALATTTTDRVTLSWDNESQGFRCVPSDYASFLLQSSGLTAIDENGEKSTAIA